MSVCAAFPSKLRESWNSLLRKGHLEVVVRRGMGQGLLGRCTAGNGCVLGDVFDDGDDDVDDVVDDMKNISWAK